MTRNNTSSTPAASIAITTSRSVVWTTERIRALGAVTDLPTAAAIFGLSRTAAYQLAQHNRFPVPVLRIGHRYRIPVAPILAALHITDTPPTT